MHIKNIESTEEEICRLWQYIDYRGYAAPLEVRKYKAFLGLPQLQGSGLISAEVVNFKVPSTSSNGTGRPKLCLTMLVALLL